MSSQLHLRECKYSSIWGNWSQVEIEGFGEFMHWVHPGRTSSWSDKMNWTKILWRVGWQQASVSLHSKWRWFDTQFKPIVTQLFIVKWVWFYVWPKSMIFWIISSIIMRFVSYDLKRIIEQYQWTSFTIHQLHFSYPNDGSCEKSIEDWPAIRWFLTLPVSKCVTSQIQQPLRVIL